MNFVDNYYFHNSDMEMDCLLGRNPLDFSLPTRAGVHRDGLEVKQMEVVTWKQNYFREIEDIYEVRGPKYTCTECRYVLPTKRSFFTHAQMHSKPFCIVCTTYFDTKEDMFTHMRNIHPTLIEVILEPSRSEKAEAVELNNNLTSIKSMESSTGEKIPRKTPKKSTPRSAKPRKSTPTECVDVRATKQVTSRFGRSINIRLPEF